MPQTPRATKRSPGRAATDAGGSRPGGRAKPLGELAQVSQDGARRHTSAGELDGIGSVGDEARAPRVSRGAVHPRVADHPDAPLGECRLEEPEARRVGLERRLVARDQHREEPVEAAALKGATRDRSGVVGPYRQGIAGRPECRERLVRARLRPGLDDGVLLVRRAERPARVAEGRAVRGGRRDELADRPRPGSLGKRNALGRDQAANLGPEPAEVERGADEGVIQVEDAERPHGKLV
jgi:hypothetical protein